MDHLSKKAQEALNLSQAERITYIRKDRTFKYSIANKVIDKLEDLFNHPQTSRMPNLLLIGETSNGKTSIIKQFHSSHKAYRNEDVGGVICPVFFIQAPPSLDESRLYNAMLDKFVAPYRPNDRIDKKLYQLLQIMKSTQVKMLIIDEFQHLLASTPLKQRQLLNSIKYIANELMIPIVAVGVKEAFIAVQTDPQLASRFEHAVLPRWEYNDEFLSLLDTYEHVVPLKKPSNLSEEKKAKQIL